MAWDPPGPTFREEKFAAYKETRSPTPSDLRSQIPYVKTLFEALHLPVLEVPGFEADDVLGTVVERTRDLPIELVLVTSDKDMLQLVSPRVRVFSTTGRGGDRVVFDEAAVKAKWGVEPAQIPDILALMGDSIDNIPGVPGVGEKTAVKLIGQFGGVERLYENLSLVPGKLRETLAANRKQALLSRELATVSTRVPIEVDLEAFRRRDPDWDRLRALWTEMEFYTLLRQLPAAAAAGTWRSRVWNPSSVQSARACPSRARAGGRPPDRTVDRHARADGGELAREQRLLAVGGQRLAQLARHQREVLVEALHPAELADQLGRGLLPHPGHAGDVVDGVAHEGQDPGGLRGLDAPLGFPRRLVEDHPVPAPAGGGEDAHPRAPAAACPCRR